VWPRPPQRLSAPDQRQGGPPGQQALRTALERTPPELSADIIDKGIVLAGGGSQLRNLDQRLREETSIPVAHCEDPESAVVRGTGKMLTDMALLKKISIE